MPNQRDGSGLALAANVKRSYGSSSGTVPAKTGCRTHNMGDLLDDLHPRVKYRTPADVRAIPNEQFERWVLGYDSFPFSEFSAALDVQDTLGFILDATCRRLGLPLPKRKRRKLL